jgi:PTS system cellobiose-specific IIC component
MASCPSVAGGAHIFNITEPVIFGVPVMLNPLFFIPMLLSCIVPGIVGYALLNILPIAYNPTVQLPWVMPTVITAFMQGGFLYALVIVACIAVTCVLWYPFFKVADNQAYEEEQAMAAGQAE